MLYELTISALCGLSAVTVYFGIKFLKYRNAINKFPGPPTAPLVGNILQIGRDPANLFRQVMIWTKQYDGMFRIWFGPRAMVVVYKAELMDCTMSTKNPKKSVFYKFLTPWLHEGLLLSWGPKWQKRRKMLTPTFHYSILEDFMPVFHQQSEKLVRILKEKKENEEFDIYPYITRCALDVMCATAMGVELNSQENEGNYTKAIHRMGQIFMTRVSSPEKFFEPVFNLTSAGREQGRLLKVLHEFTNRVIENRWREYEEKLVRGEKLGQEEFDEFGKKKRLAFLDLLIQNSMADQSMTITNIQEEVDTFMFEGHDTTTSAITWALYNLAKHPKWQEKIREEILQNSVNGACPSVKQVSELKLLDCFLKESTRLFTTVPFIGREVTDECYIGPYFCPKGTTIGILLAALHRDPRYFPDPEKFDPERWMKEDIAKRHPFCYLPFSSGLRNCIGQKFAMLEWKMTTIAMIKNFKIFCEHNLDDLNHQDGLMILKPARGVHIKLQKI